MRPSESLCDFFQRQLKLLTIFSLYNYALHCNDKLEDEQKFLASLCQSSDLYCQLQIVQSSSCPSSSYRLFTMPVMVTCSRKCFTNVISSQDHCGIRFFFFFTQSQFEFQKGIFTVAIVASPFSLLFLLYCRSFVTVLQDKGIKILISVQMDGTEQRAIYNQDSWEFL